MNHTQRDQVVNEGVQTAKIWPFGDRHQEQTLSAVSRDSPSRLPLFERVYSGAAGRADAIKAKCLECCWMDEASIRDCSSTSCPLHAFRPFQASGTPNTKETNT